MDNYFTSINLENKLNAEKTTLLETITKQRKEVQKIEEMMKGKPLYSLEIQGRP